MNDLGAGKVISSFREEHGMSQVALAQVSGFTPWYIRDVEDGRESPTLGAMIHLANLFNVKVSTFFDVLR